MPNLTITSATRDGPAVVVKGTAANGPVTVELLRGGVAVDSVTVQINADGSWEATFPAADPRATQVRASEPGGKQVTANIT